MRVRVCVCVCVCVCVLCRNEHEGAHASDWGGDEQVRNYYIDLLKRMDDSNDAVRIQCAAAFENFMASVPRNYDSAQYDYIVRGLVVHLDDQNQEVLHSVLVMHLYYASDCLRKDSCKAGDRCGMQCFQQFWLQRL